MDIHGLITVYRKDSNAIIRFERGLKRMESYGLNVETIRVECFDALRQLETRAAKTVADYIVNNKSADTVAIVRQLLNNY